MNNKTCKECRYFDEEVSHCERFECNTREHYIACYDFKPNEDKEVKMNAFNFRVYDKTKNRYIEKYSYCFFIDTDGQLIKILENGDIEQVSKDDYIVEYSIGICDKNGELIYDGDLLGISKEDENFIEICWSNSIASFMCDTFPKTNGNLVTCYSNELSKLEIIGNINEMKVKDE